MLDLADTLADKRAQVLDVGAGIGPLLQLEPPRLVLGQQVSGGRTAATPSVVGSRSRQLAPERTPTNHRTSGRSADTLALAPVGQNGPPLITIRARKTNQKQPRARNKIFCIVRTL